jgi:hypothetical protein
MAKSDLTTGKHRNLAWDAELKKDWKEAYKQTSLALHKYPKDLKEESQLAKVDIDSLKKRMRYFKSMLK